MKKKLVGIIAGLLCCGCFIGVIIYMSLPEKEQEHEHEHTEQSGEVHEHDDMVIVSGEDISAVTVSKGSESFTLEVLSSGETQIKELSGLRQDEIRKKALLELCKSVKAAKLVEEHPQSLEKYGLDKPVSAATINYKDGKSVKVCMGEMSVDGSQCYTMIQGQDKVWLVEKNIQMYFSGSARDYVSTVMSPRIDKDNTADAKITVTKPGSEDMVLERRAGDWSMSAPINAYVDEQKSTGTINGIFSLTAEYCETVHPDDEAKKAHGIGADSVKVKLEQGKQTFVLYIGSPAVKSQGEERDKLYCYLEGEPSADCIFAVDKEYVPWAEITPQDIISQTMIPNYLVRLKSIVINAEGKTREYTIYNTGEGVASGDISKITTEKVTKDGAELDLAQFRRFYEFLMKCPVSQIYTKDDNNSPRITVIYNRSDGKADKLELVQTDKGYGARINGKMSYLVDKSWVDALVVNITALEQGGEIRT
ncbi:DUF4340 domain-containing protein [Ruminococcus sp. FC2018]|uniref:DUF4340 domain-containing protein n=1 Tax=Ruminococcus sp. FC2018 TaxID=1410617 RepID=UPI00048D797F|nr:DUF4340 domain-containing protein [Ruminococcus sp. FC2018]